MVPNVKNSVAGSWIITDAPFDIWGGGGLEN